MCGLVRSPSACSVSTLIHRLRSSTDAIALQPASPSDEPRKWSCIRSRFERRYGTSNFAPAASTPSALSEKQPLIFQSTIGRSNSPLKPAAVSFGSGVRERRATSELSQTRATAGDASSRIATKRMRSPTRRGVNAKL